VAAPRTGTLAASIVGGRLRSLTAVELLTDYLALNTHIVFFCHVWFMGRLRLNGRPPMRQQLVNFTRPLRRQAREYVLQIDTDHGR
jgi:hypothetical protein